MADGAIVLQNERMPASPSRYVASLAIFFITLLSSRQVHASLGGDAASVLEDAGELHATVQVSSLAQYQVAEIVSDNGMRIREFLDRNQAVFAVSWAGPAMPDLHQLLGTEFAAYSAALAARDHLGLHRSVRVATPDLVVESDGHVRAFAGRAYLPGKLPADVSITQLR